MISRNISVFGNENLTPQTQLITVEPFSHTWLAARQIVDIIKELSPTGMIQHLDVAAVSLFWNNNRELKQMTTATPRTTPRKNESMFYIFESRSCLNLFTSPIGLRTCSS